MLLILRTNQYRRINKFLLGGFFSRLNPKNWGIQSYDTNENGDLLTFNLAYGMAREAGDKVFRWHGNRYNTNYKYSVNEDLYKTKFTGIKDHLTDGDYKKFADVMTPIFRVVMEKYGIPLLHLNNLVRQAGLESHYGVDPRGEQGFNLGGIKWFKGSMGEKYKKTQYTDGEYYIDFDSLYDYADFKVRLLKETYHAFDATNTLDFIDRLHGNNPGKKNYSGNKDAYIRTLTNTRSLNRYLNPKYDFQ